MGIERAWSPDYFRKRAEEMRTKAYNSEQREVRETLLRAAIAYDELAESAAQVETIPRRRSEAASPNRPVLRAARK